MPRPKPTPIYRFVHIDNLDVLLRRATLHAPLHTPKDGLAYRTIHNVDIQDARQRTEIPCGPGGVIHDYVSFYFGPRTPMLLQLHTGRVAGYAERQEPIIYLITTIEAVVDSKTRFVFSDGHGIAAFTDWYDSVDDLDEVDWGVVYARYWADTLEDMDRQRRKQAKFLVFRACPWSLVQEIAVVNENVEARVEEILSQFPRSLRRVVRIRPELYY